MRSVWNLAAREVAEAVRNRWVAAAVLALGGLAFALAVLGAAPGGATRVSPLAVAVANLSSLGVYLVPLLALMLSFDAIVGERERGTLGLLLCYPVSRGEVLAGKALGQLAVLALALVLGYGAAGAWVAISSGETEGWRGFAAMIGASALLGAAFLALGLVVSVAVRERATAVAAAVGLWLALVVLYDLALLGVLLADDAGRLAPRAFALLVLANPTDAYRIATLAGTEAAGVLGTGAIAAETGIGAREGLLVLALWTAAAGAAAALLFRRREL